MAVYVVFAMRELPDVNSAVIPAKVTVPETTVVPCRNVKVVVLIVDRLIVSLKVAAIFLLRATPLALLIGSVEITVGGVISPVEKFHT